MIGCKFRFLVRCLALLGIQGCAQTTQLFSSQVVKPGVNSTRLGVIVNAADPLSVRIGKYYQERRQIPPRNMITVRFATGQTILSSKAFQQLKEEVEAKAGEHIQAFALTWAAPYRVDCMSITTAFTLGFDLKHCAEGCKPTQLSPYFNSISKEPYTDLQIRPTMAIAARTFDQAKALIDRGVSADGTAPQGTAYLMQTSDSARNVRAALYPMTQRLLGKRFDLRVVTADRLEHQTDVMFYFTGLSQVEGIDRNRYLPGAIADHLTSAGGMLTDSPQMSSLRWLEAGATGSYGAVVEPCNFLQKFPHPGVVMFHYLAGNTLIEAYWKSVAQPGQGIFIGEPLARPFLADKP